MTRDDIENFTRQAGGFDATPEFLERFAALVVAAEREACAKVCEAQRNIEWLRASIPLITHDPVNMMASKCAASIRARGETK